MDIFDISQIHMRSSESIRLRLIKLKLIQENIKCPTNRCRGFLNTNGKCETCRTNQNPNYRRDDFESQRASNVFEQKNKDDELQQNNKIIKELQMEFEKYRIETTKRIDLLECEIIELKVYANLISLD